MSQSEYSGVDALHFVITGEYPTFNKLVWVYTNMLNKMIKLYYLNRISGLVALGIICFRSSSSIIGVLKSYLNLEMYSWKNHYEYKILF